MKAGAVTVAAKFNWGPVGALIVPTWRNADENQIRRKYPGEMNSVPRVR